MYTVDAETLKATRDLAAKYGVPLLTHLAETRDEVTESMEKHKLSPDGVFRIARVLGHAVAWPRTACTSATPTSRSC